MILLLFYLREVRTKQKFKKWTNNPKRDANVIVPKWHFNKTPYAFKALIFWV